MDYRRIRWKYEVKRKEMKITKISYRYEPRMTLKKRTFWEWLTRKPQQFIPTDRMNTIRVPVEFESLTRLLEHIALYQSRGQSCQCCLNYDKRLVFFTVDKGRKKLAIQCSGFSDMETRRKLDMFLNLLEKDSSGIPFDIADKYGKTYEVVFNIVNTNAHREYNRNINTGG